LAHPEGSLVASRGEVVIGMEAAPGARERAIDLATRAATALEAARLRPIEREAVVRCAFCHADVEDSGYPGVVELVVRCGTCAATVHAACWKDHDGCPVLGCSGTAN